MSNIIIDDNRNINDFKNMTFSGYKLSEVKNELLSNITNNKIENICYWTCELMCSGHFLFLWEFIIMYMSKYIHTGNIKISLYLELRFNKFKEIINKGYIGNELRMRNNEFIRVIFFEIMCTLSYSNKRYEIKRIKVNKDEFFLENIKGKLTADSLDYVKKVFKKDDPKDLFVAINELMYHLEKTKNVVSVCYWIEWILQYELNCNKKKESCDAEYRNYDVDEKNKKDIIWLVWDCYNIVLNNIKTKNKYYEKIYNSLLSLFTIRYKKSSKRKRIYILYLVVSLLIENIDFSINMINNKDKISKIVKNRDKIFKLIKKNEVKKSKKGLNSNDSEWNEGNLENTFKRLDIMDKIMLK